MPNAARLPRQRRLATKTPRHLNQPGNPWQNGVLRGDWAKAKPYPAPRPVASRTLGLPARLQTPEYNEDGGMLCVQ
jgi:hypothetical protein